jgi:tetratricopeptide (TPR) repeat protein
MRALICVSSVFFLLLGSFLRAQEAVSPPISDPDDPLLAETRIWEDLKNSVKEGRATVLEALLQSEAKPKHALRELPATLIAQRAVGACGRLRNEGDYEGAQKLARLALKLLDKAAKKNAPADADRAYYEAVLRMEFLGDYHAALPCIEEGLNGDPEDLRLLELKIEALRITKARSE